MGGRGTFAAADAGCMPSARGDAVDAQARGDTVGCAPHIRRHNHHETALKRMLLEQRLLDDAMLMQWYPRVRYGEGAGLSRDSSRGCHANALDVELPCERQG